MNKVLKKYLAAVRKAVGAGLNETLSEPFLSTGIWFVNLSLDGYKLLVQYSSRRGFGLSVGGSDFGNSPDEQLRLVDDAVRRTILLLTSRAKTIPSKSLSELRGVETQSKVACAMEMKQPSYAKMEGKRLETFKVETLEKAVGALHGTLYLLVEINGSICILQNPAAKIAQTGDEIMHKLPLTLVAADTSHFVMGGLHNALELHGSDVISGSKFGALKSRRAESNVGIRSIRRAAKKAEHP